LIPHAVSNVELIAKVGNQFLMKQKNGQLGLSWDCNALGGCSATDSKGAWIGDYEYKFNGNELTLSYPAVVKVETPSVSVSMSAAQKVAAKPNEKLSEKSEVTMFTAPKEEKSKKSSLNDSDSLQGYMVKVLFVLVGLIGIIVIGARFFKRMITGKNKLGFLKKSHVVEILNTTYIGPKRQLLLVRAHEQVVLVASHETGVEFLCEVNDLANLLKEQEKAVAGSNFDTSMSEGMVIPNLEAKIKLKDPANLFQSRNDKTTKSKSLTSLIKNRIQDLKAMQ
jgi:flagellar biogenesis protein FliO